MLLVQQDRKDAKAEVSQKYRQKHSNTTVCNDSSLDIGGGGDTSSATAAANLSLNRRIHRVNRAMDDALPKSPTKMKKVLQSVLRKPKYQRLNLQLPFKQTKNLKNKKAAKIAIQAFWEKGEVVTICPDASETIPLFGDDLKTTPKRFLVMSLREAHSLFKEQNPDNPCSLSWFSSLRPYDVFLLDQIPHTVCLCEYCNNYQFAYEGLRKKYPHLPQYTRSVLEEMVCANHTNQCWNNSCSRCSDGKGFLNLLGQVDETLGKDVKISEWGKEEFVTKKGEKYERTCLLEVVKPDLISHVKKLTMSILTHHYVRCYQTASFQYTSDCIETATSCTCDTSDDKCWYHTLQVQVDFSENYKLQYQNEVSKAHYHQPGISLFTISVAIRGQIHSHVVVSPHTEHTIEEILPYLTNLFDEYIKEDCGITEVLIYSDGARQQFKTNKMMRSLEWLTQTFKVQFHWNFMASYHGKGRVDGIGAVLKQAVWKRVKSGWVIVSSYIDFCRVASEFCPEISVVCWDDRMAKKVDRKFKIKKWLASVESKKTVMHLTSYHHFWQPFSQSGVIEELEHAHVTLHSALTVPIDGSLNDEDEDEEIRTWSFCPNVDTAQDQVMSDDSLSGIEELVEDGEDENREENLNRRETTRRMPSVTVPSTVAEDDAYLILGQNGVPLPEWGCPDRTAFFKQVGHEMSQCHFIHELVELFAHHAERIHSYSIVLPTTAPVTDCSVDISNTQLLAEIGLKKMKTLKIAPYGNCFTNCLSVLLCGDEDMLSLEMRVRCVEEQLRYKDLYMGDVFLRDGMVDNEDNTQVDLEVFYARESRSLLDANFEGDALSHVHKALNTYIHNVLQKCNYLYSLCHLFGI